jgi:hypothetical protein
MSREEGGFLGETLADDGAPSEPVLTGDGDPDPSGLRAGGPFAAALGGAASAGRRRGSGGDFRSTCGIGIGGTNRSSLCATDIARGAKKLDAGDRTGGAARASPNAVADTSRQRQNRMVGNALTPTIIAPARNEAAARLQGIVTIYGAIWRRCDVELWPMLDRRNFEPATHRTHRIDGDPVLHRAGLSPRSMSFAARSNSIGSRLVLPVWLQKGTFEVRPEFKQDNVEAVALDAE